MVRGTGPEPSRELNFCVATGLAEHTMEGLFFFMKGGLELFILFQQIAAE